MSNHLGLFSTEVIDLLGPLCLLDHLKDVYISKTGIIGAAYLSQRLLSKQHSLSPRLDNFRQIAARFAREDIEADNAVEYSERYEEYIEKLSFLITKASSMTLSDLFSPAPPRQVYFATYDLSAAAAYLGRLPTVVEITEAGHNKYHSDSTIADISTTCAIGGNIAVIDHLLQHRDSKKEHRSILGRSCFEGHAKVVEYLIGTKWMTHPKLWTMSSQLREEEAWREFHYNFMTPNLETFNAVMEYKQKTDYKAFEQRELVDLVRYASEEGWEETMAHLLSLGAPIDGEAYIRQDHLLPLRRACQNGSDGVVRLLLRHNARITGLEIRAAAAKGRLSTVRILLEHGADANGIPYVRNFNIISGKRPHPIVSAIRLEHDDMFRLLVKHDADLTQNGPEAVRVAREGGLDSMLQLLKEHGVSLEESLDELK